MTDFDDDRDETEQEAAARKKKKGEGDRQERAVGVDVGEGFYAKMASMGASTSVIAGILKGWRHLRGDALMRALSDFLRRISTRATAHVQVDIAQDKDYSLLHNFIQFFRGKDQAPTQRRHLDASNKLDPK